MTFFHSTAKDTSVYESTLLPELQHGRAIIVLDNTYLSPATIPYAQRLARSGIVKAFPALYRFPSSAETCCCIL